MPEAEPVPAATDQAPDEERGKAGLFPRASAGGRGRNVGSVLVATAPMLSDVLAIDRALRPLKREVPSAHAAALDEDATAARIADQPGRGRQWIPVMRPSPERWLSLAFVVDTGPAMAVWRSLARELQDTFVRLGAFREPRTWYLRGGDICATPDGLPQHPAALIRPAGRQVILVLSDCSGANWWNGQASRALGLWARQAATAVLQPLPERLWRRTAMPSVPGLASLLTAGAPNSELVFSPYDTAAGAGVPVPVLEIARDWLADWVRLVRGSPASPVPMAVAYVAAGDFTPARPFEREQQLSIAERVGRFQNTASSEAARLAACLAVSFPSLPVLRLLQHQLLGSRQPAHLAEVLLSGLLRPADEKRQTYEFVPGARQALLASMPRSESWYVADALSRISAEIEALADKTRESFEAFLQVPKGAGYTSLDTDAPIALVSPDAVRYLRRSLVSVPPPRDQPQPQAPAPAPQAPSPARVTTQSAPPADVFVSYAPQDRPWAEWVESILAQSGLRALLRSALSTFGGEMREMDAASLFIAILSPAFTGSPAAMRVWDAAVAGMERTQRRLLPVHIARTRLTGQFADFGPLDLLGLDADQAEAALRRALAGLGRPAGRPSAPYSVRPRFPGTVPVVSNLPARNANFTGRIAIVETLRDQLTSGGQVVLAQTLHGLGGVGKTQVALEYAHRFRSSYDVVWWVPSETPEYIAGSLADLGHRLGIRVGESVTEGAAAAGEALRRGSPYDRWLIVFDNAQDPRDLQAYLPGGPGHVLVTSRNPAWSPVAAPLEVDVFARAESVELLLRRVPAITEADAARVAEALGDLPLAIEQAAAWLAQTGTPAAAYVEQLEQERTRVLDLFDQSADYPTSVAATWQLSFERLRERSAAAARLLELCAFFAPEPISMTLLYSDEMISSLEPFDPRLRERLILGQLITEIGRFALARVDRESNSVQVHRLIQAVIRARMTQDERDVAMHEVHRVLAGARPRQGDTDDPQNWPRFDLIWPHLGPSQAEDCDEEEPRQLLIDRVRYLWKRGDFESALQFGRGIEEQWRQRLGPDHRQTLYVRFHLASVLRSMGRYEEARAEDAEVLQKQRQVLSDDHPHTLQTAGALAGDLRGLGEFQRALDMDRQTYERLREIFGDDHPITLSAANNLAVDLGLTGDFRSARELARETLERRQAVLGPDHPYTLHSAASLARDIRHQGGYAESAELLRTTYARYLEVLGEDFADTLRTATSLAVSLRKAGDLAQAHRLTAQARQRYMTHYPADFPDSLACSLAFACDQSALGDYAAAGGLALEVMGTYERNLGADHPCTLVAASNAATCLRGSGDLPAARGLLERALAGLRAALGDSHPHALSCAVNLANCLSDLGESGQASDLEADTRGRLRETLGDLHPDTLTCGANLAVSLRVIGREDEALRLHGQILNSLRSVLGDGHFAVEALRQWRRRDIELEPF